MSAGLIHSIESVPLSPTEQPSSADDRNAGYAELQARFSRLTSRERQVTHLIVAGLTSREMAEQLGISARTIGVHRSHIMLKMGTKRVPELVRWTMSFGL